MAMRAWASAVGVLLVAAAAPAAEPFRYPEAAHGKGRLRYRDGVPVVTVEGTPAEIGEQMAVLVLKPARGLLGKVDDLLAAHGLKALFPVLVMAGNGMTRQFPPDHLAELEAAAAASGWPRDVLVFANTVPDLGKLAGCSALLVGPGRSATGGPLFGRNMDTPPALPLHEYTFVAVYRPAGKRPFAAVGLPGAVGCVSGMNDAGLAVADLTVAAPTDGSARLDPAGVPYTLTMRRVLEECGTVGEAEKLVRAARRTTMQNLAVCDREGGAVLEVTTKSVVPRRGEGGVCACTNHFRVPELAGPGGPPACDRYARLEAELGEKLSVADVTGRLARAHQGRWTVQSMVFEPAALRLHLAVGEGPATALPYRRIELKPLLAAAPRAK